MREIPSQNNINYREKIMFNLGVSEFNARIFNYAKEGVIEIINEKINVLNDPKLNVNIEVKNDTINKLEKIKSEIENIFLNKEKLNEYLKSLNLPKDNNTENEELSIIIKLTNLWDIKFHNPSAEQLENIEKSEKELAKIIVDNYEIFLPEEIRSAVKEYKTKAANN